MKIVALGQQKGGVGKSAAAINLACQAVAAGEKSAVIDMDAEQGTTLKWGARRNGKDQPAVLTGDASKLKATIEALRSQGVDWVFLDLPGRNAPIASAGLAASDFIVIPCRPNDVDIEASVATVQAARRASKRYAYLMSIVSPQQDKKRAQQVAGTLVALGHAVAPDFIIQRPSVPDAIARGSSAVEDKASSDSAGEFKKLLDWIREELKK